MFEWIVDTKVGRAMKEISDVFQPTYNDIGKWSTIKDIGTFSDETIAEWQEAWAVVPKSVQKKIYGVLKKLQKLISPAVLVEIIELYLNSIKK